MTPGPATLLLVDAEDGFALAAAFALTRAGHAVRRVASVAEAEAVLVIGTAPPQTGAARPGAADATSGAGPARRAPSEQGAERRDEARAARHPASGAPAPEAGGCAGDGPGTDKRAERRADAPGAVGTTLNGSAARRPDLVVLDTALPDGSGWALCARLRASPGAVRVPILMTSARGGPVEGDKARALGADAFLAKPLTLAALRETVARLLADQDREVNA